MESSKKDMKIGRIGFWLALAPWVAYAVTFGCAVGRVPGFG